MAESNSINKSLFFLGKLIERLAGCERRSSRTEYLPVRDSNLTRLLSLYFNGNSRTGLLVTLTPSLDAVEESLSTLRFAQKASTIRCNAQPIFYSREQMIIAQQQETIAQLSQEVQELRDWQRQQQHQLHRHPSASWQPQQPLPASSGTSTPNSTSTSTFSAGSARQVVHQLRDENSRLRANMRFIHEERARPPSGPNPTDQRECLDESAKRSDGSRIHGVRSIAQKGRGQRSRAVLVPDIIPAWLRSDAEICLKKARSSSDSNLLSPSFSSGRSRSGEQASLYSGSGSDRRIVEDTSSPNYRLASSSRPSSAVVHRRREQASFSAFSSARQPATFSEPSLAALATAEKDSSPSTCLPFATSGSGNRLEPSSPQVGLRTPIGRDMYVDGQLFVEHKVSGESADSGARQGMPWNDGQEQKPLFARYDQGNVDAVSRFDDLLHECEPIVEPILCRRPWPACAVTDTEVPNEYTFSGHHETRTLGDDHLRWACLDDLCLNRLSSAAQPCAARGRNLDRHLNVHRPGGINHSVSQPLVF